MVNETLKSFYENTTFKPEIPTLIKIWKLPASNSYFITHRKVAIYFLKLRFYLVAIVVNYSASAIL